MARRSRAAELKAKIAKQKMNRGVSSTCLRRVEHDGDSTLTVEFRRGARYKYFDVPPPRAGSLADAASVGKYYNRKIKYDYEYELTRASRPRRGAKGKR